MIFPVSLEPSEISVFLTGALSVVNEPWLQSRLAAQNNSVTETIGKKVPSTNPNTAAYRNLRRASPDAAKFRDRLVFCSLLPWLWQRKSTGGRCGGAV